MSRAEFQAVTRGTTQARVAGLFDASGTQLTRVTDGYWEGAWVEDGYWDSEWIDTSWYDYWTGEWIYDGYWSDEWIDTSYWDSYDHYVTTVDTVRSYRKCSSWGPGWVGVNFDNYTSNYSGMRVYRKVASNPWQLVDYVTRAPAGFSARAAVSEGSNDVSHKPAPKGGEQTLKPESQPLTPDPHPVAN